MQPVTVPAVSRGGSVAQIIIDAIHRFGPRLAVSDGNMSMTYAELGDAIARTMTVFSDLGLKRGSAIAVLTTNRAAVWPSICAANIMGVRYTPIHPMSSEDDQLFVCQDAEIDALLVDGRKFGERGQALIGRLTNTPQFLSIDSVPGAVDIVASAATAAPAQLVDPTEPEDLVWLIYTGGTTGRSKGVMLSHRCVAAMTSIIASEWEWPAEIRFAAVTPISHAAGITLYPVMLRGGCAHFLNGFEVENFCSEVQEFSLNSTFLVPTIISLLVEAKDVRERFDLSSLELVIYGAAPISPSQLKAAMEALGPIFLQLYGQTEVPQVISILRKADHDLSRPDLLGSCGKPNAISTVRLLDSHGQEVPVGEPGEICVRGTLCCSGYWKQPELTAALFKDDWLHTGDVAIRDKQGFLYIVDRTKDLIITGGFNIYPREVEDALSSHPSVLMAGVIGVPDPKWGEAVKAFVKLREGCSVEAEELQEHVKACRGAPWAPKSVEFMEQLPLTGLGKLDRKALRAPYWKDQSRSVT